MLTEVSRINKKSFYRLSGQQLQAELQSAETTAKQLIARIEQLWLVEKPVENLTKVEKVLPSPVNSFSNQMKFKELVTSENNKRITCSTSG
jgi:hypothetical protein